MRTRAVTPAEEREVRLLLRSAGERLEPTQRLNLIRAIVAERPRPRRWTRLREVLGLMVATFAARPDGSDPTTQYGAPARTGTPNRSKAVYLEGHTAMTTIIQRHARDLHAGDVIVHDPDHDRPVRWRVTRPPVRTADGEYALADYADLVTGGRGVLYFRVLAELSVEPAGGAA